MMQLRQVAEQTTHLRHLWDTYALMCCKANVLPRSVNVSLSHIQACGSFPQGSGVCRNLRSGQHRSFSHEPSWSYLPANAGARKFDLFTARSQRFAKATTFNSAMALTLLSKLTVIACGILGFTATSLCSPIYGSSIIDDSQPVVDTNSTNGDLGTPRQPFLYHGRQGPVMFIGYGMPPGGPWASDIYATFPDRLSRALRASRIRNGHSLNDPLPPPAWSLSDSQGQMRFMISTTEQELHYSHVEEAIQGLREWLGLWAGEVVPSTSFYLIKGYGADARRLTNGMIGRPVNTQVESVR